MKVSKNPEIDPDLQRLDQLEPSVLCFGVGVVLEFLFAFNVCVCSLRVYTCSQRCVYICVCICALESTREGQKWMPDVLVTSRVLRQILLTRAHQL